MHVPVEAIKEIQGPLLTSIMREVIDRQGWIIAPSHIDPQPGLLDLAVTLDLKRM